MVNTPPATGNAQLDRFLRSVADDLRTLAKPREGWRLSDFSADVSEVISDRRDLIDVVRAWGRIEDLEDSLADELKKHLDLYDSSLSLNEDLGGLAGTFSEIQRWWDENPALYLEDRAKISDALSKAGAALSTSQAATSAATSAESKAGNAVSRVTALEALGGLSPESPVDGQTANLVLQGGSLTRAAIAENFTTRRPQVYDSFEDVEDGARPTTTASGHTWGHLGSNMEVRDGLLSTRTDRHSSYSEIHLGAPVRRMGADFIIDDLGGTATISGSLALPTWNDGGVAANGLGRRTRTHFGITQTGMAFGMRDVEGTSEPIIDLGRVVFDKPLDVGVMYRVEYFISGDTMIAIAPNGEILRVTDPRISEILDEYACWEPFRVYENFEQRTMFRIARVWADSEDSVPSTEDVAYEAIVQHRRPGESITLDGGATLGVTDPVEGAGVLMKVNTGREIVFQHPHPSDDSTAGSLVFHPSGDIHLRAGVDAHVTLSAALGIMHHRGRVTLSATGQSIFSGAGSPEGVLTAPAGSLFLSSTAGTPFVWVKTSNSTLTTGWSVVGSPSGVTSKRPSAPVVGMHFFDTTLGKPIWWNGTAWVDADGAPV